MGRLAWSQLRFRMSRAVALLIGLLVATTAFTVLTAATRTAQARTIGTVSAHFAAAYDILVRPKGSRTALETRTGTVQPNFLAGIYGGITMAQYHEIAQIPGVQVAAPIAMVGYALLAEPISFPLPAADYATPGRQLYRISTTYVSVAGTSRIARPASYLYVTPNPLRFRSLTGGIDEMVSGHPVTVAGCGIRTSEPEQDPFGAAAQSETLCWSKSDGSGFAGQPGGSNPGFFVDWALPVLIAAVDPEAEAKLDGLNRAVVSGSYLTENATDEPGPGNTASFPVLAASTSGVDEYAVTQLEQLAAPARPPALTNGWVARQAASRGRVLAVRTTTAAQAYQLLLRSLSGQSGLVNGLPGYWSIGGVSYRRMPSGALQPRLVRNPQSVWYSAGFPDVSMDNADNQYRAIAVHSHLSNVYVGGAGPLASPRLVGTFDPAKILPFDPLSAVPLGAYQPVVAVPANPASREALHGGDLLPNSNLGGYVSQPADLVTTLSALPVLEDSTRYGSGNLHAADPISVIRVRVAGVTGPNPVSLERIREVAQQIAVRTHLDVDIVAGSSPEPTTIDLPAGKFGQPALTLSEGWVKKGVAVAILDAIDKNSLTLFVLILVVCVLFVANSAAAAVRGRRRELGVLACLGWTRPRLFAAVLGELAAIGLAAGILGAAVALPLSSGIGLHASVARAALAVPIAVVVAVIAGLTPAWLAASAEPVASVRPPVLTIRRARQPAGVTALATVNVLRTPGRSLLGAISLAVGVTSLTVLAALSFAFRGVVVGSLLGDAVAVQVRSVDYVAVIATVGLGVLAVADVLYLNIRERAAELAAVRALGWPESALSRLVITEGTIIGLAGSLAGAAVGLAAAASFAGQLPAALYAIAAAAVIAGTLVTAAAALLPASALRRLPAARLLAED
ncbi:MAG TPA: FtsX-like permease family protein [Streptosporangiaceae bacterium]|nr:FtsX-like permease family protein [Streptosporangiaceae bacterium]